MQAEKAWQRGKKKVFEEMQNSTKSLFGKMRSFFFSVMASKTIAFIPFYKKTFTKASEHISNNGNIQ